MQKKFPLAIISLVALIICVGCSSPTGPGPMQVMPTNERTIPVTITDTHAFTKQMVRGVSWAVPNGMDLVRYPILPKRPKRKLSDADVIRMGLRLSSVPAGTVLYNEDPERHAFWLDTMRTERKVWVNEVGEIVYIEDCGNRAMEPEPKTSCPASVTCTAPHLTAASSTTSSTTDVHALNAQGGTGSTATTVGAGSGYSMPEWLKQLWRGLANLVLLLLALALIALLLALAYLLARWLQSLVENGNRPAPAYVPPAPFVAAPARRRHLGPRPVIAPPVAAAPVQPKPEARFHRYGPYDDVQINNAGEEGFRVTAFNGDQEIPLGVFQWADVEPADGRREYVVVMI